MVKVDTADTPELIFYLLQCIPKGNHLYFVPD